MKFWSEFRDFALKRNAMDLAIGVVVGAAFQRIVDVLVQEVFMPPLSWLSGSVDTTSWILHIGPVPIGIGALVHAVLQFLLIAVAIFAVVKATNRLRRLEQQANPKVLDPKIELLREIRDLLKHPKS